MFGFHVVVFNFFGHIPRNMIAGSYDKSMFNFIRSCQTVFLPKWLYHCIVVSVSDLGHSNRCAVACHCCSNLHFSDDTGCRTFSHVLDCHLYISCVRCPLKSPIHFKIGLFIFLLSFESSLCWVTVLYQMCPLQILSLSLWLTHVLKRSD